MTGTSNLTLAKNSVTQIIPTNQQLYVQYLDHTPFPLVNSTMPVNMDIQRMALAYTATEPSVKC